MTQEVSRRRIGFGGRENETRIASRGVAGLKNSIVATAVCARQVCRRSGCSPRRVRSTCASERISSFPPPPWWCRHFSGKWLRKHRASSFGGCAVRRFRRSQAPATTSENGARERSGLSRIFYIGPKSHRNARTSSTLNPRQEIRRWRGGQNLLASVSGRALD